MGGRSPRRSPRIRHSTRHQGLTARRIQRRTVLTRQDKKAAKFADLLTRNCTAEAFFSSLEWEVLSRHDFVDNRQPQTVVPDWCCGSTTTTNAGATQQP
jgi:hypothetical protein